MTGAALEVHHGYHPNTVRLIDIKNGIGKNVGKMPSDRWIKKAESVGLTANIADQSLHLLIKASAQFRADAGENWAASVYS